MSIGGSKGTSAAEKTYMGQLMSKPQVYQGERVAGFTPEQQQYQQMLSAYGQQPTAGEMAVGGIAGGTSGIDTSALQEQYGYQATPYIQQQVQDAAQQALGGITSKYAGAGRLGSGAFADTAARGVTAAMAPTLASAAQADAQRRASLASQLAGYSQSQLGMQLQAAPLAQEMALQRMGALGTAGAQQQQLQQAQLMAEQAKIDEANAAQQGYMNQLSVASDIKRQKREEELDRLLGVGKFGLGLASGMMGVPGGFGMAASSMRPAPTATTTRPTFGQYMSGGLQGLLGVM